MAGISNISSCVFLDDALQYSNRIMCYCLTKGNLRNALTGCKCTNKALFNYWHQWDRCRWQLASVLSKPGTCLTFHVSCCFLSKAGSGLSTINSATSLPLFLKVLKILLQLWKVVTAMYEVTPVAEYSSKFFLCSHIICLCINGELVVCHWDM